MKSMISTLATDIMVKMNHKFTILSLEMSLRDILKFINFIYNEYKIKMYLQEWLTGTSVFNFYQF